MKSTLSQSISSENLIYKRTVFNFKAKLNKDNITKEGYFNLEKIPNLRVLDNGFLKSLRWEFNKTQKDFADMTNVPLRTWIGWESYGKLLPFSKLLGLSKKLRLDKIELYKLLRGTRFTYGLHHGKNKLELPLCPREFNLSNYLVPQKGCKVYVVKSTPEKIKKSIIKKFSIDKTYFKNKKLIVIYSHLLNQFLKTFYHYKKEQVINFPLSKEIPELIKSKSNLTKSVIIPLLLSDGGEKPNSRLYISGSSKIVHDLWSDAFYYQYKILPSSYKVPYKGIFVTTHNVNDRTMSQIKELCPNFKKSPVKQKKEDYLAMPQPNISFLANAKKVEQQTAIRIWAITEGSIGISLNKKTRLINPSLKIACAHPKLLEGLKQLSSLNCIKFNISREPKIWSGLNELRSTSIRSAINFIKIGGFIKGVKITKLKSKYFGNFDKQETLLGILEFIKRQRINKNLRTTNKDKIYKKIAKIIANKEFKKERHYIKIFDDKTFDNWYFRRKK